MKVIAVGYLKKLMEQLVREPVLMVEDVEGDIEDVKVFMLPSLN